MYSPNPLKVLVRAINCPLEELEAALAVDASRYRDSALGKALKVAAADGKNNAIKRLLGEPGWAPTGVVADEALWLAAVCGHPDCVSILLEACPQITSHACSDAILNCMDEADVVRALAADARTVPSARALAQAAEHESAEIRELFAELGVRTTAGGR